MTAPTGPPVPVSDDGRRMCDEITTHYIFNLAAVGWVAVRLRDGGTDHQLYATRDEAIRHTDNLPDRHFYVKLQPGGMNYQEAERLLRFARKVHEAGGRFTDPYVIHGMPNRLEHLT